jgi:hypothetical protein
MFLCFLIVLISSLDLISVSRDNKYIGTTVIFESIRSSIIFRFFENSFDSSYWSYIDSYSMIPSSCFLYSIMGILNSDRNFIKVNSLLNSGLEMIS